MDYNISDAELPTMIVRYDNRLILRSVITGQHLEDLGTAPIWDEVPLTAAQAECQQLLQEEHNKVLEELISFYPCVDLTKLNTTQQSQTPSTMPATTQQQQSAQLKPPRQTTKMLQQLALQRLRQKSPVNTIDLPPCKVQRNYCCNVCNFCTQNPRSHLLHQRHVHGIRLSIHCCQHCQYASRYFQKLKRHVKMVHTSGGSPHSTNGRRKRIQKPKQIFHTPNINREAPPTSGSEVIAQTQVLPNATPTTNQNALPNTKPIAFTNPEAFFEAAYRNQLLQQQLQIQHLKDLRKAADERELEAAKLTTSSKTSAHNFTSITSNLPTSSSTSNEFKDDETKRIYNCRKCSYMTHIKSRYNKHIKYHSMPMIQCDKCEFRTTYKWNLTRHLRSHHGNGLYKCSVCSFSAHMKQSLTSHELNHHLPPVGHASRNNKIYRRRRCRVGGSDLAFEANLKAKQHLANPTGTETVTPKITDNMDQTTNVVLPHIKQEPMDLESESSIYSTQTSSSIYSDFSRAMEQINENNFEQQKPNDTTCSLPLIKIEPTTPSSENKLTTSKSSSSISSDSSSTSSSSGSGGSDTSSSSSSSNLNDENDHNVVVHEKPMIQPEVLTYINQNQQLQHSQPETLYENQGEISKTLIETTQLSVGQIQNPEFSNSVSSIDNCNNDDEDGDSMSTVSADETVPDGLHIAYESSPPTSYNSVSDNSNVNTDWSSFDNDENN